MADQDFSGFDLLSSSKRFRQIADNLKNGLEDFTDTDDELPGLADLLLDIVDPKVDVPREQSVQRLMQVFFDSKDNSNEDILARYSATEQDVIKSFVLDKVPAEKLAEKFQPGASLGAREKLPIIDPAAVHAEVHAQAHGIIEHVREEFDELKTSVEDAAAEVMGWPRKHHGRPAGLVLYNDSSNKVPIDGWSNINFENWGRTIKNKPTWTFVPRTSYGVQQIVKYARAQQMNVRAAGYRHSWSPVFGKDGGIIISTLGLLQSTFLPNIESLPGSQFFVPKTELRSIDFIGTPVKDQKRLVRVGTAVTNQQFRRWCIDQKMEGASTLPMNVIMVEITLGGSNAPICHGAGRTHPTLSDLVHTIEYVDTNGEMRTLSRDKDPQFMSLAGGCFGLLGIVTHITLELDAMSYAIMTPKKLPVMKAIPPPPGMTKEQIPTSLWIDMTEAERQAAQIEFERSARDDFYTEWFWFPYTSKIWVNCWNITNDPTGAREYPSRGEVVKQWLESVAFQFIAETSASLKLQEFFPEWQVTAISKFALNAMPDIPNIRDAIKTPLPNALHFRRAVQNTRVRDMEIEIPLLPKHGNLRNAKFDDEIDFTYVQRAFWDAICLAYRHTDTYPQRMPLEMRITGPSNVLMAPFRGHTLGTCSIEILTLENMADKWGTYAQECLDLWMSYRDNEGNFLSTRPHWAKEWANMDVRGEKMLDYLKDQYKDAVAEFKATYGEIAKKQKWSVAEARQRFSNPTFEDVIWDNMPWKEVAAPAVATIVSSKHEEIRSPSVSVIELGP